NLDTRNREFINDPEHMPKEVISEIEKWKQLPTGEEYIQVCELILSAMNSGKYSYKSFPELSFEAWVSTSEQHDKNSEANNKKMLTRNHGLADEEVRPVHFWIYAPGDNASKWDEFYEAGIMAIGWGDLGDLSEY